MSEQLVKRLRELSNAVTRADWNEFSMRIPVEKDRDADFVLLQAADKIEALEADAARYRFLRNNPLKGAEETMPYIHSAENDMRFWALTLEDADATIDAAMQVKP